MDDHEYFLLDKVDDKKMQIVINGTEYLISTHFSALDTERYVKEQAMSHNYKKAISKIIYQKILDTKPNIIPRVEDIDNICL